MWDLCKLSNQAVDRTMLGKAFRTSSLVVQGSNGEEISNLDFLSEKLFLGPANVSNFLSLRFLMVTTVKPMMATTSNVDMTPVEV